jgi:ABC-2 family transporter protein
MSQLLTLIWLKWRLLRNSLRSSKAVVNKAASILGMLVALVLSLSLALILGGVAYALSNPDALGDAFRRTAARDLPNSAPVEFIFFSILGLLYLMWATVPLSIGGSKQFDAGKLLMYPITLRKLFAVDFVSELTTLHSVFAIPAVLAISIGAGLGSGDLTPALFAAIPAIMFGVALSKWVSTIIGSLLRRKRARGETIVALIGALVGLGAAAAGQVAPLLFKHADSVRSLRWTPPGAAAFLLVGNTDDQLAYAVAFLILSSYAIALIIATYWIARRAALGFEGRQKKKAAVEPAASLEGYSGWQLPLVSSELSAIVEKEIRYAMRNAQIRMMALMPLVLLVIRLINSQRWRTSRTSTPSEFLTYGSGLLATGGVMYVFLIMASLSCNQFAFEKGGMRTLILSPVDRRKILLGKNIALTVIAFIFCTVLLALNTIVFRDLTPPDLLFVVLSFVAFAAISSTIGNWLSIRFPKHMRFGKRLNVSGMAGLLLIPMVGVLSLPPLLATLVGYLTQSLVNEYLALLVLSLLSVGLYFAIINLHGRTLARREIEILDAVREPSDE